MACNYGPMYLRINRNDLPVFTDESQGFEPGMIYTQRKGQDVAVFATGIMVSKALDAADVLAKEGISVGVFNVPSLKPLNAEPILDICKSVRGIVTAEEHSIYGGLGDALSSVVSANLAVRHVRVGVQDRFGTSAENYDELLEHYGLNTQEIVNAVRLAYKGEIL